MTPSNKSFNEVLTRLLGKARRLADEDMDADIARVRERIGSATLAGTDVDALLNRAWDMPAPLKAAAKADWGGERRRSRPLLWKLYGAVAAVVLTVTLLMMFQRTGAIAVVEASDEGLHRLIEGRIQPLKIGEEIMAGQVIRSDGASSAMLAFLNGSRFEMRSMSEVALEGTASGHRIRLNDGTILVSAANADGERLYVDTKDATVSLVDTVAMVTSEETHLRVAVLEGEALVERNGAVSRLRFGEQLSIGGPERIDPVQTEIAWSRYAKEHSEILPRATAQSPGLRFEVAVVRAESENPGIRGMPVRCTAGDGILPVPLRGAPTVGPGNSAPVPLGRCVGRYVSLLRLITTAYEVAEDNVTGGPDWIRSDSDAFQIEAKAEATATVTKHQMRAMLQTLLADRFNLKFRRETKEGVGYTLTVARSGLKAQQASTEETLHIEQNGQRNGFNLMQGGQITVKGRATMKAFADYLSSWPMIRLNRVVDQSNLPGLYQFVLNLTAVAADFAPGATRGAGSNSSGPRIEWNPPLAMAIEQQLGLALLSEKVPEQVLVIESVERPRN